MPIIDTRAMLKQNMKRIIQKETDIHELVSALDLGSSSIYENNETIKIALLLSNTLAQMDADLSMIIELLDN